MLVCQDRECGYRETISRTTNARCPKCHKRMEMYVKGKEETFVCQCGYKEKLSAFQARRQKEGAGVGKRDVQNYLRKQQKEANEPVNNTFAQALSGIKLYIQRIDNTEMLLMAACYSTVHWQCSARRFW